MHNKANDNSENPERFVSELIAKYQEANSPSDRKRVNALATMARRTGVISEIEHQRYTKEKKQKISSGGGVQKGDAE